MCYPRTPEMVVGVDGVTDLENGWEPNSFKRILTKLGMWYPYTPGMVTKNWRWGLRGRGWTETKFCFSAHLNQTWHVVYLPPGIVMCGWGEGFRNVRWGTKFGVLVHLNEIWHVVSLHTKDGNGGRVGLEWEGLGVGE